MLATEETAEQYLISWLLIKSVLSSLRGLQADDKRSESRLVLSALFKVYSFGKSVYRRYFFSLWTKQWFS